MKTGITGKSYSELLRDVKTGVNVTELGVQIRTVKKTVQGDLLLEVRGGNKVNVTRWGH